MTLFELATYKPNCKSLFTKRYFVLGRKCERHFQQKKNRFEGVKKKIGLYELIITLRLTDIFFVCVYMN